MKNPFSYFDKTFVISAKDNAERRKYMKEVLSKLDINYEFFDAIIGENLSEKEINEVYDEKQAINHPTVKRPLSKPEIGCTLSHMEIYKKIVQQDLDHALIFEDDIVPVFENLAAIETALKELPENWDLLYFGTLNHHTTAPLSFLLKLIFYYPFLYALAPERLPYQYRHLRNIYPRNYSKSLKRAGHHPGLHAYAMSRSGAKKFFDYHDKIITAPDYMPSVMIIEDKLNAFMTKELLFEQNRNLVSALEASRLEIRKRLKSNKMGNNK